MITTRTMATNDPHQQYRELMSHPRLREYLRLALMPYKDLQQADREDIAGQVMVALWRRRDDEDAPNNVARLIALAKTVLQGKVVDFFRHRALWRGRIAEPTLPSDDSERAMPHEGAGQLTCVEEIMPSATFVPVPRPAPDPAERRVVVQERMAVVQEKIADGTLTEDDIEVMRAQHFGEKSFDKLAAERTMTPSALRQRIKRIRKALREAWNIRSTTLLVTLLLLVLLSISVVAAVARRPEPPPPPPREERTLQWSPRGAAPQAPDSPPPTGDLKPPVPR
jgi:DNA-directed RNA polymerase specialized sigma24 family protein